MNDKARSFLLEMVILFRKYNVTYIGSCSCCSGTHVTMDAVSFEQLGTDEDEGSLSMSFEFPENSDDVTVSVPF